MVDDARAKLNSELVRIFTSAKFVSFYIIIKA